MCYLPSIFKLQSTLPNDALQKHVTLESPHEMWQNYVANNSIFSCSPSEKV